MSKEHYSVKNVSKFECEPLLRDHHYLTGISKGFKSGFNVALFYKQNLNPLGVCIFTGFPTPELAVGAFGLPRDDQKGLWELSRLVLHPDPQKSEHNLSGWFLSQALRLLRQHQHVRAVLSYADQNYHAGTVYRATGFGYYGLTAKKKDFWSQMPDGTMCKQSRGKVSKIVGEWRDRSRKHRFMKVYDKKLDMKWELAK
jgi:hypothetical protein|tara:strand:+ start:1298 stop:1894 length:597 start_codon:yes stop_codon:yes gene_type:complete